MTTRLFIFALKDNQSVLPLFIFDTNVLLELEKDDSRITFIYNEIEKIKKQLAIYGSDIIVEYGEPLNVFKKLIKEYNIKQVYCNKDHEPYGIKRDLKIKDVLEKEGIPLIQHLDHLISDKDTVLKPDSNPYNVFTHYKNRFKQLIGNDKYKEYDVGLYKNNFLQISNNVKLLPLEYFGFKKTNTIFPPGSIDVEIIQKYHFTRDMPSLSGTSKLGIHLRFGTISIRELFRIAVDLNSIFLDELIWREFYAMILMHYPDVVYNSFKKKYDEIQWLNNEADFEAWKNGQTGYPFVDAGMRQLNESGFMHNRLRMVTASFLTKHLLIDWRWGEAYFAKKLLDYELSSNNGGWQWSAGSGCDAAPYFRIFNPSLQQKRFDPKVEFIQKWVSEYKTPSYPKPIVEHEFAVSRCKSVYRKGLT